MSRYQHQLRPAPRGVASAIEMTAMQNDQARAIKGFLPGRYSELYLSHVWATLTEDAQDILGVAWYGAPMDAAAVSRSDETGGRLLVWRSYSVIEVYRVYWGGRYRRGPLTVELEQTLIDPCPHPSHEHEMALLGTTQDTGGWGRYQNEARVTAVQYRDELFFCHARASSVRRLWRDATGAFNVAQCGVPRQPGGNIVGAAGSPETGYMTADETTYKYRVCWSDEHYRLSSPWRAAEPTVEHGREVVLGYSFNVTKAAGLTSVTVSIYCPDPGGRYGIKYVVLYRAAQGTEDYYAVNCVSSTTPSTAHYNEIAAKGVMTLRDMTSEADLVTGATMPAEGQNDPPPMVGILCVHGNRLWCDDRTWGAVQDQTTYPWVFNHTDTDSFTRLWASHVDSPTQFNSASDPDDQSLGMALNIGTDMADPVSALSSLGSTLGVWTRNHFYIVQGSGPAEWAIARMNDVGCVNHHTLAVIDNRPYWLGHDGVYTLTEGFAPGIISLPINDMFNGPRAGVAGSLEYSNGV